MMFDRGRLDKICHFQLFYGEKKDQIGRMIQMDSRDGSDEVLEKPSVEIASYYLAEEKLVDSLQMRYYLLGCLRFLREHVLL